MKQWQKAQNLVSRETLDVFWSRHICDSARLYLVSPGDHKWLDIGSGAGFPGLVTAILQANDAQGANNRHVFLVESNARKVAFLRAVIRETDISASVVSSRIEDISLGEMPGVTHVSARAVASLDVLFAWIAPFFRDQMVCYFHKGRNIAVEIEKASNQWIFDLIEYEARIPGNLNGDGVVVEVRNLRRQSSFGG